MNKITVETTLPILEAHRLVEPIVTNRLIIRPIRLRDIEGFHALYSQPEVRALAFMGGLRPEFDITHNFVALTENLRPWIDRKLDFSILLQTPDGGEGEFIGLLSMNFGDDWPRISYMLRSEYWSHGYMTEGLTGFLEFWWGLPRTFAHIEVSSVSLDASEIRPNPIIVSERVLAIIEKPNRASRNVLRKADFVPIPQNAANVQWEAFVNVFPAAQISPETYRKKYWGVEGEDNDVIMT
ncbi:hypothetical protein K445DRAFT_23107 [Daldinia sp. EC12]|nr:GNAT domain-containing protein [Daldinia eschscholtzii]OTB15093.1 hypothetical protein K445DRAFT_23107 [Daldinia sp. EC12]